MAKNLIYQKLELSKNVSSLGADFLSKIKLLFLCFFLPVKKRIGFTKKIEFFVKLRKSGKTFSAYLTEQDMSLLSDIFFAEEYDISLIKDPKIIFDLGSNIGLSVIYFRLKYPLSKIYAFEPDALVFKTLQKNTKQFKDNVILFNFAISDIDGTATFFSCYQTSISSSLMKKTSEECKEITIETRSLDSIIKQIGINKIDLLKFDIEGAEFKAFKNFKNLNIVDNLIGELHLDLLVPNISKNDFLSIFKNHKIKFKEDYDKRAILEIGK